MVSGLWQFNCNSLTAAQSFFGLESEDGHIPDFPASSEGLFVAAGEGSVKLAFWGPTYGAAFRVTMRGCCLKSPNSEHPQFGRRISVLPLHGGCIMRSPSILPPGSVPP